METQVSQDHQTEVLQCHTRDHILIHQKQFHSSSSHRVSNGGPQNLAIVAQASSSPSPATGPGLLLEHETSY